MCLFLHSFIVLYLYSIRFVLKIVLILLFLFIYYLSLICFRILCFIIHSVLEIESVCRFECDIYLHYMFSDFCSAPVHSYNYLFVKQLRVDLILFVSSTCLLHSTGIFNVNLECSHNGA